MKMITALEALANSTNALDIFGNALMIGDKRISAAETRIARAGTRRLDTTPSLLSCGDGESTASWYKWRPAE